MGNTQTAEQGPMSKKTGVTSRRAAEAHPSCKHLAGLHIRLSCLIGAGI